MSTALLVFKAVSDREEQKQLLEKLLEAKGTLSLKNKDDHYVPLTPLKVDENFQLHCQFLPGSFHCKQDEKFMVSFHLNNEKYLFETQPEIIGMELTLPIENFFHLQKRQNFRYTLPKDFTAEFMIEEMNEIICSYQSRLVDLSTEGCAIEVNALESEFKEKDTIRAQIYLGEHEPIEVQGHIKNIRTLASDRQILGVEFNHLAHASEDKIVTSLTNLQRDIYFRKVG